MLKFVGRALAGIALAFLVFVAAGGLMSAAGHPAPRGTMVDIGEGRRLRLVCEGPVRGETGGRPVVWLEAGAFGLAADWGAVQQALAADGWRSCAYDRAGMGFSPPGPAPRDGLAIVADFEKLVAASGEPGPYILAGHSMAGLRLREYVGRNRAKVAGLVLIDAATAEASTSQQAAPFLKAFTAASRWAARGASIGLFKPLAYTGLGDKIGLPPAAKAEKRWAFANGRHNRTAADEVALWPQAAEQALAVPAYDPDLPIAVVTAGPLKGRETWKAMQAAPALASRRGYVDHVEAASHTRLLGEGFADRIVKAVAFVAGSGS